VDLLARQVSRTPDAVAVQDARTSLTYAGLWRRASATAELLGAAGCGPDAPVVVCAERSAELVVALAGAVLAGAPYVPVDPQWPAERQRFVIDDVAPAAILHGGDAPDAGVPVLRLDHLPTGDGPVVEPRAVDEHDAAYVLYTSGSTGRPKGVVVPHRGLVNRLRWMQDEFHLGAADTVLQKTPYTFDVSVWEFFWPLVAGGRLYVAVPEGHRDPEYLVELIRRERVTIVHFVPSMLALFLREPGVAACESLRLVISSGEVLTAALANAFRAVSAADLYNLYGPTEASIDVTSWRCRGPEPGPTVPIGRPITGVRALVLDERRRPVGPGIAGELYLGGVCLADGYLNRPDLTRQAFVPDPTSAGERLYRTGDLVRWAPDGYLEYIGRMDNQVKLHGVRIEPGEIEALALEDATVGEAVAVVRDDGQGPRLVLYVVPATPGTNLSGLRGWLGARLPAAMVPTSIVELERMPVTANGKCDRGRLPAPATERRRGTGRARVPRAGT
jgi:amino acid adenylation domain-containing protein